METTQEIKIDQTEVKQAKRFANPAGQIAFSILAGLFLATLALGIFAYRYEAKYKYKVYPHVSVNNIELTGMSLGQAVSRL